MVAVVTAHPILQAPTTSQRIRVTMAYTRPLLANDADAEATFLTSLGGAIEAWPFQHARLQLAYGQWLRRQRRTA